MEQYTLRRYFPAIAIVAFIAGCAKVNSPTGGPKDYDPPVIVKSMPENGARNFRGNEVSVTFNEYVTLDQINQKFMVSPPMKKKPKVALRGKSVVVKFDEPLHDSTTYTLNFQDAIRDLNQGNVFSNFQFVFSTGPVIDSLSVTGNVYSALTLSPPEETLVLLYSELADSAVHKHVPSYISRTDKNGYFRINNIKEGTYRLYALKDADNSKNFNLPDEEFAFCDSVITVSHENDYLPVVRDTATTVKPKVKGKPVQDTLVLTGNHKLFLFKPEKKAHYFAGSSRPSSYRLNFALSIPPDSFPFRFTIPGASPSAYRMERSVNRDSLIVWLGDTALVNNPLLKTVIYYPFTDSTGAVIERRDSVPMRFMFPKATRGRKRNPPYQVTSSMFTGGLKPGQKIILSAKSPFGPTDTSRINIYELVAKDKIRVPYSISPDTSNLCKLILNARLIPGKTYMFNADSAAFRNDYGEVSDSVGYRVSIKGPDMYGKLILNISGYTGNKIIQLLTKDEKLVREIVTDKEGKLELPYIDRGPYRLRVVYDLNGDGKWNTGDFDKGIQPEPVSYLPKELELKENWDDKEDWNISEKNVKNLKNSATKPSRR
jgi:uncharacterized protein (DUF2141 family)